MTANNNLFEGIWGDFLPDPRDLPKCKPLIKSLKYEPSILEITSQTTQTTPTGVALQSKSIPLTIPSPTAPAQVPLPIPTTKGPKHKSTKSNEKTLRNTPLRLPPTGAIQKSIIPNIKETMHLVNESKILSHPGIASVGLLQHKYNLGSISKADEAAKDKGSKSDSETTTKERKNKSDAAVRPSTGASTARSRRPSSASSMPSAIPSSPTSTPPAPKRAVSPTMGSSKPSNPAKASTSRPASPAKVSRPSSPSKSRPTSPDHHTREDIDLRKLHPIGIKNSQTNTQTHQYYYFKLKCERTCVWGRACEIISLLERTAFLRGIPSLYFDPVAVFELAFDEFLELRPMYLKACIINEADLTSSTIYTGPLSRSLAATKIQATYRMFHCKIRYYHFLLHHKAAVRIQGAWGVWQLRRRTEREVEQKKREREEQVDKLLVRLREVWETPDVPLSQPDAPTDQPAAEIPYKVIVHLPSHWYAPATRKHVALDHHICQNEMGRLFDLANDKVIVVYISSIPVDATLLQYYRRLLALMGVEKLEERLIVVYPENISRLPKNISLATAVLCSPLCLSTIRNITKDRVSYIVPGRVGPSDWKVALAIDSPLFSTKNPVPASKSFISDVFTSTDFSLALPRVHGDFTEPDLLEALSILVTDHMDIDTWMIRVGPPVVGYGGFGGVGVYTGAGWATIEAGKIRSYYYLLQEKSKLSLMASSYPAFMKKARNQIALDLKQSISKLVVMCTPRIYSTWEKFLSGFTPDYLFSGTTTREFEEAMLAEMEQTGVQREEVQVIAHVEAEAYLRVHLVITPTGTVRMLSTHELLLVSEGLHEDAVGAYPLSPSIPVDTLSTTCLTIGSECYARGVIGYMSIDLVWGSLAKRGRRSGLKFYAIDLQLGNSNLLWSHNMFLLLSGQKNLISQHLPWNFPSSQPTLQVDVSYTNPNTLQSHQTPKTPKSPRNPPFPTSPRSPRTPPPQPPNSLQTSQLLQVSLPGTPKSLAPNSHNLRSSLTVQTPQSPQAPRSPRSSQFPHSPKSISIPSSPFSHTPGSLTPPNAISIPKSPQSSPFPPTPGTLTPPGSITVPKSPRRRPRSPQSISIPSAPFPQSPGGLGTPNSISIPRSPKSSQPPHSPQTLSIPYTPFPQSPFTDTPDASALHFPPSLHTPDLLQPSPKYNHVIQQPTITELPSVAYITHEWMQDGCLCIPYSALFELCRQRALSYDYALKIGTAFSFKDELSKGVLGMMCIAGTKNEALTLLKQNIDIFFNDLDQFHAHKGSDREGRRRVNCSLKIMLDTLQKVHKKSKWNS